MIRNVGLDIGNSFTKVFSEKRKFSFPSLVKNGYDSLTEDEKIHVNYNETNYSIGIGDYNITKIKYFSHNYKILVLTALAKLMKEKNGEFNIVLSLPVDKYRDAKLKEDLIKQISEWGTQEIIVDNEMKIINIKNVGLWSEAGIVVNDFNKYKTENIIVVDIGGFTWDIIEFDKNKRGLSFSEKKGILTIKEDIYRVFKEDYNVDLDTKAIDDLFNKIKNKEEFKVNDKIVNLEKYYQFLENYIMNLFSAIEKSYSLTDKKIIFIGGGSLELKDIIEKYSKDYTLEVSKSASFANAEANYIICNKYFNKEVEKIEKA